MQLGGDFAPGLKREAFMHRPNLFEFATSELSQDAAIAWLLSWADPSCESIDGDLSQCARKIIAKFFALHGKEAPGTISKIKVSRQDSWIDILCIVNGEYAIVIEDKASATIHGDQLDRYFRTVEGRGFSVEKMVPIYFKTHDECSSSKILESGYRTFSRGDLLEILRGCESGNHILCDFRERIEELEEGFASYRSLPLDDWHGGSWMGFYKELETALEGNACKWYYVANPSGGFQCFVFPWLWDDSYDCGVYLQLEEAKLCFKVGEPDPKDRRAVREKWHKIFLRQSKEHGFEVERPGRFGSGAYMTVALLKDDYRAIRNDGLLDFDKTADLLRQIDVGFRKIVAMNAEAGGQ